jgi:alpha-L-fucosidase
VKGIDPAAVERVRLLSTGTELKISHSWAVKEFHDYIFVSLAQNDIDTVPMPDERDTVIEITVR